ALHGFELIQLEVRVRDGEQVARLRLFVKEHPPALALDLFFHFEDAFALEHYREDESRRGIPGIVQFDELSEQRLGVLFLNGLGWRGRRRFVDALPVGDEPLAVARAVAFALPARLAQIQPLNLAL